MNTQQLVNLLSPLVNEYLTETKSGSTVDAFLREFAIYPIRIEGILMGFWALRIREAGATRLATVKAIYLRKQFRGRYLNRAADDLVRGLAKQGVTNLEIWAYPKVMLWLKKRYQIKPEIYVTNNPLSTFQINSNCKP